jgi:acyl carrier protein
MAIEEEFAIEIPDEDADAITSVGQGEFWRGLLSIR